MYDVTAFNSDATVTVPAKLLHSLISVAQGYTLSHGRWLDKGRIISEADHYLYFESDYDIWGPSLLVGSENGPVVNPEALP